MEYLPHQGTYVIMAIHVVKDVKQMVVKNADWFTTNEQFDAACRLLTSIL